MKKDNRPKTIFIDIDGTIFEHPGDRIRIARTDTLPNLLPGVQEQFTKWDQKGYKIILVTGRRESDRFVTEEQLQDYGIFYDQLIMGVTGGERILINDAKPKSLEPTARAFTLPRNEGIEKLNI